MKQEKLSILQDICHCCQEVNEKTEDIEKWLTLFRNYTSELREEVKEIWEKMKMPATVSHTGLEAI